MPSLPLIARAPGEVMFRTPDGAVTASVFLAAAHRLAAELTDGPAVVNLCQDRLRFTVAFAAAMIAGRTSLLVSDRSPQGLQSLVAEHGEPIALIDEECDVGALRSLR